MNFVHGDLESLSVVRSPLTVVFIRAFATRRAFRYIFARFISASLKNISKFPNPRPPSPSPAIARKGCRSNP